VEKRDVSLEAVLAEQSSGPADFFTNLAGLKLPNYQQNQFGSAAGGPIKKDGLFFFGKRIPR
jgi:hypothetical protein